MYNTGIAAFKTSSIKVKYPISLFPVLKTLVAPMFPEPTFRKSPSPRIFEIRIPKGTEPAKYPNAQAAIKAPGLLVNSGSNSNIQK